MLKQNTAITARRCSTAITLVLRRPNTQDRARAFLREHVEQLPEPCSAPVICVDWRWNINAIKSGADRAHLSDGNDRQRQINKWWFGSSCCIVLSTHASEVCNLPQIIPHGRRVARLPRLATHSLRHCGLARIPIEQSSSVPSRI